MPVFTQAQLITKLFKINSNIKTPANLFLQDVIDSLFDAVGGGVVPTGIVAAFPTAGFPAGWLLMDGAAVSRTTYSDLFALIGTAYGVGNGTTTFNLPNGVDKYLKHKSASEIIGDSVGVNSQSFAHTHGAGSYAVNVPQEGGTLSVLNQVGRDGAAPVSGTSGSSLGTVDNKPLTLVISWCIKT